MIQYLMSMLATRDDEGQGMVEYGLIIVLVALVAAVGLAVVGTNLDTLFDTIAGDLVP